MILSLLKAYKSVFYPRSIIIATNGKNTIEAKREANKAIFLIVRSIRTDFIFYIFNDLSFLVVFKPSYSPFWNRVFGLPSSRNSSIIKSCHLSKFFYTKVTFFELLFKILIIHNKTFEFYLIEFYHKIILLCRIVLLTFIFYFIYNLNVKNSIL